MKIKKFVAPDIRRAIRMVREEQGPDAVILSNRRVEDGVEIVSAVDYDESLFHQVTADGEAAKDVGASRESEVETPSETLSEDDYSHLFAERTNNVKRAAPKPKINPNPAPLQNFVDDDSLAQMREELKYLRNIVETRLFDLEWDNYSHANPISATIIKKLIDCGVSPKLARMLGKEIMHANGPEKAWEYALAALGGRIKLAEDDIIDGGGIIALVGPTGVGKTTTVAKLAARYALRRGIRHVGLITTDNYRVGAHEQLRTYGRLLDIPMRSAGSKEDLQSQLDDFVDKDLVLIDTAGMSQRDMRISEQLSVLRGVKTNIKVYLVLPATSQLAGLEEVINVFRGVDLDGCIITKLDEASRIGPVVSAVIEQNLPVAYISDGQRVPEDLHVARADKLVNKENFTAHENQGKGAEELMHIMMERTAQNAH